MTAIPTLTIAGVVGDKSAVAPSATALPDVFAALLAPLQPVTAETGTGRQTVAAPGKDLPSEEEDRGATDLSWITTPIALPPIAAPVEGSSATKSAGGAPVDGTIKGVAMIPATVGDASPTPTNGGTTAAAVLGAGNSAASMVEREAPEPTATADLSRPVTRVGEDDKTDPARTVATAVPSPPVAVRIASAMPAQVLTSRGPAAAAPASKVAYLSSAASTRALDAVAQRAVPQLPLVGDGLTSTGRSTPTPVAALPSESVPDTVLPTSSPAPLKPVATVALASATDGRIAEAPIARQASTADVPGVPALAPNAPPASTPASPVSALPALAPAARVFAEAIHRAVTNDERDSAPMPATLLATGVEQIAHAVAATGGSRHAALDMARDTWPQAMIARIEALRDASDANDTSIRLIPDRLGAIDVSLRRDGDTVTVHFAAQHAETRQMIAEAQPRLAELAEARGLKLSTGTGEGQAQPQSQSQAQPQSQQRASAAQLASNRASTADADDTTTTGDGRIA